MARAFLAASLVDRSPETCREVDRKTSALRRQFEELRRQGQGCSCPPARVVWITCPCGCRLALYRAFKCAECGFYFCRKCAMRHFGLDVVIAPEKGDQAHD